DTNFGTAYLGGNTAPTVVTVTAGQTAAAGQITVPAATSINITSGTPVRGNRGQSLSVWLSGAAINTATNVSIPGNGVTITGAQILSASQARLDLTIDANAPLGSRTMILWVTNGGDCTALTGGLDVLDASGNSVSYPGSGSGPTPPSITTTTLPNGQVGAAYNQTLAASGGTPPYTWSLSAGSLPTGLTLAASTGLISGTPTATGAFSFTARVTDANSLSATRALSITIDAATLNITTTSLPNGQVGAAYSRTLAATGGTTPYTWSLSSGSLPTGLALNASTGAITGTPTATGTSSFTVRANDSASRSDTQALSITIDAATLNITTTSLASGQVNVAYSQTLAAAGGTTPYTWSLASGSLPTGLSLNASTGAITGTPTAAGTFNFTARATDSASRTDTQALSIVINASTLSITTSSLPNGSTGTAYSQTLAATGGTTPYTWSLASG
ncbi:MAG: Ig domain-containing protein, partial [Planctomycetota bacterium]